MNSKVVLAIVIAWLAAASEAMAQNYCELERIRVQSEGDGAFADFSSVDTSTCALGIETTVHVESSEGARRITDRCGRGGGHYTNVTHIETNLVGVAVRVYDRCLGAEVSSITGSGVPDDFHVSNNLRTASLRATLEGLNEYDEPVPIAIDLVWISTGQRQHTVDRDERDQGLVSFSSLSSGTVVSALASGSVTVNGVDRTPLESTQGTIERDTAHSLMEYR
ncbi:MAG TPA: hypothetical protein VFV75_00445 [Candidatus Polarisedimenticolaceae bacterium]|nr:hypothetical protein [Candidatus Polarisedimenticolaceae bacterium]